MPFRSGLRSGVRGPLYADAVGGACRGAVAFRCACATPAAVAIASVARPTAPAMEPSGFFIRLESTAFPAAFGRWLDVPLVNAPTMPF
jgi:hypothetical protein